MLKFFFWTLLLGNAALFAYQYGYLETVAPNGREPARMADQLNADKIRLLPADSVPRAPVTPVAPPVAPPAVPPVAVAPATPQPAPVVARCVEIGNFNAEEAKQFAARLAELPPGGRISQHSIREVLSHMVYIPPQGDRQGAERKVAELRQLGVNDLYIIQDNSDLRWGISLGVFKLEERARAHLAMLTQKGVRAARIGPHSMTATMVAFQVRELDAGMKAGLDNIKADFPLQESRSCEAG